jgi:WD40 repeat protein
MSGVDLCRFTGAIMKSVLSLTVRRRHRIRAAVVAGALVAGLGAVLTPSSPASAATPDGYPLPITRTGDIVVDGSHQRIFIADRWGSKVVAVGYDGTVLGTASNLPGVEGLALSPDESTLYAAAVNADAIVAINTESVTETARYATGAGTEPMYLAAAGGKIWFGYGSDGGHGGLGSLDPAVGQSSVTLDQDVRWYNAPMLAATSDVLALADPYTTSGSVRILNVAGGSPQTIASRDLGSSIVEDLAFSPDGSRLLTAYQGPKVDSWQTSDLSASTSYATKAGRANAVAVAPDGRLAAGTTWDDESPRVHVFLPDTTTPVRQFQLADSDSTTISQDDLVDGGLVWEPNGTRLFAISSAYPDEHRLVVLTDPTMSEPKLTVSVPATAGRAKTITVSGSLTSSLPLAAGTGVTVTRTDAESPKGKSLGVKTINATGGFSFTDTPAAGGKLTYRFGYAGDATHLSASAVGVVTVPSDASGLTLNGNGKTYAYGTKATFTAKLGKAYTNKTVEIWADPYGADQGNRLIKKAVVSSKGTIAAALTLTRSTSVTAVYRGDTRTAAKSVKSTVYTKVRIAMAVSKHYKSKKIGKTTYYVFHKKKDPIFTTTMTAATGRSQRFTLEYYYKGKWRSDGSQYFKLSSKGKSQITLVGTHETNLKMRVRSAYIKGKSGDSLNATTIGAWRNFIFTS